MKKLIALFAALLLALTCTLGMAEPLNTPIPEASVSGGIRTLLAGSWAPASTLTADAVYMKCYDGRVLRQGWQEADPTELCDLLPGADDWSGWDWEKQEADPAASCQLVWGDGTLWAVTCQQVGTVDAGGCLLYTPPSPRDLSTSRMPSSA